MECRLDDDVRIWLDGVKEGSFMVSGKLAMMVGSRGR